MALPQNDGLDSVPGSAGNQPSFRTVSAMMNISPKRSAEVLREDYEHGALHDSTGTNVDRTKRSKPDRSRPPTGTMRDPHISYVTGLPINQGIMPTRLRMLQIPPGQYRQVEREDNLAILRRERFAQIVLDEEDAQPANPISRSTPAVEPEGPATSSRVKESNLDDALVEVLPGQARGGIEGPTMAASNVNTPTTAHRTYQHNDLASAWRHDRAQESSHAPEARAQQLADCITSYCKGLRDLGKQVAGTKEIGARVNEDALKRLEAEVERRRVEVLRNDRINRQMEMRLTLDLMAARGKQFIGDLADLTKTQDDLRASMLKVSEDTLWLLNQLERVCGSFSELGLDVSSLNEAGEVKTLQREKTKAVTQALEEASM